MNLHISAKGCVKDLKREFSRLFPFLKIELFRRPHQDEQGSEKIDQVHEKLCLSEVTGIIKEGVFSFDNSWTVTRFESTLQQEFGLPIQVFRKAGDLWLETIQTDKLSLKQQNEMGRAASQVTKLRYNVNTLFL